MLSESTTEVHMPAAAALPRRSHWTHPLSVGSSDTDLKTLASPPLLSCWSLPIWARFNKTTAAFTSLASLAAGLNPPADRHSSWDDENDELQLNPTFDVNRFKERHTGLRWLFPFILLSSYPSPPSPSAHPCRSPWAATKLGYSRLSKTLNPNPSRSTRRNNKTFSPNPVFFKMSGHRWGMGVGVGDGVFFFVVVFLFHCCFSVMGLGLRVRV